MKDKEIIDQPVVCTIAISCGSDSARCLLSYNVQGVPIRPFQHPSGEFNAKHLNDIIGDFRSLLDKYSRAYNNFLAKDNDVLSFDREAAATAWHGLAQKGRDLYRTFFNLQQGKSTDNRLESLRQFLKGLADGARITFDGGGGNPPWGLMYDEFVPAQPDEKFLAEVEQHFWGLRYQLEMVPNYPPDNLLWQNRLDNAEETRIAVTINKEVGEDYGPRHIKFFEELLEQFRFPTVLDPPAVRLFEGKQELLNNILGRREPQHLLYFFCHHKKGKKFTEGWYQSDETTLVVKGGGEDKENDETLSLAELKALELIPRFEKANPVIFMNACESSQTEVGDPSSFMLYFIEILSAGAFIGTEAAIPTAFAESFGENFIAEFLLGLPIGQILFEARRYYAKEHNNFFGLYYTLYGKGTIRLSKHVDQNELVSTQQKA